MDALVLLLKEPGVKPNLSAADGATPILIAAQNGHTAVVRFLIEKGVEVKKTMKSGATPLFVAAQNGFLDIAEELVAEDDSLVNMRLKNGTSSEWVCQRDEIPTPQGSLHLPRMLRRCITILHCCAKWSFGSYELSSRRRT